MGIMDRLSRLIRANVNDMIDHAEDPEKMIDQILRDMQSGMTTARAQVASMIAQEKELEADLTETRSLSGEWERKARRAVEAGKDDLAREALRRKRDNDENARVYAQQLQVQESTVAKLKSQLRQLESKYQTTMSQRDSLVARQRRAKAQQQVAQTLTVFSPMDPSSELDRMEGRIRSSEAHAAALVELGDESYDAQFRELEDDGDIEAMLSDLKSGKELSAGGTEPSAAALGSGDATTTDENASETAQGATDRQP